ncbi:ABC transporter ATP-binding protein [Parendozoicomonas haliclonae]|uniref:Aliphatic sulfonates import ATP-binding protein SsuB n=1 Tax=Parendozoicomonas haliclonae TaxID=1960125 RepID=A0A1X7ANV6_9GAMM|nr:ABC transporter ATP-binding protein [Parendozoicomonas haliclonae]SMA49823.1 Aliphatic sulfonates import ATP-binding protein SsuB [Parendozoicomonas haliclonae]
MFDVHLHKVGLAYGDLQVFQQLDLSLKAGQWTCLLGGSGVGKTTLLRMVAGLVDQSDIRVEGRVTCDDGQPLAGRIAWMSQQDSLLPWATVLDNITIGERLRTRKFLRRSRLSSEALDRAHHMLELVGLDEKARVLPQNLSGGQRQRVALARTLFEDRPVVLMDEPFGALDAITRLNLQDMACDLLAGKTVMLITHDPLEALRLGHAVYHLRGHPAQLTDAITPPGKIPRSLDNAELMTLQGVLLDRLRHEESVA